MDRYTWPVSNIKKQNHGYFAWYIACHCLLWGTVNLINRSCGSRFIAFIGFRHLSISHIIPDNLYSISANEFPPIPSANSIYNRDIFSVWFHWFTTTEHYQPLCCWIYSSKSKYILFSFINSLWPSDTKLRQRSVSTLAQVMACCLTAPIHYLNQCWLIISEVQWHSYPGSFTRDPSTINHWNLFENYISKISFKIRRGQWVN